MQEPPSDIWGLGCVVCEMSVGNLPGIGLVLDRLDLFNLIADEHELPQVGA